MTDSRTTSKLKLGRIVVDDICSSIPCSASFVYTRSVKKYNILADYDDLTSKQFFNTSIHKECLKSDIN